MNTIQISLSSNLLLTSQMALCSAMGPLQQPVQTVLAASSPSTDLLSSAVQNNPVRPGLFRSSLAGSGASNPTHAPVTSNRAIRVILGGTALVLGAALCLFSGCVFDSSGLGRPDGGGGDGGPDAMPIVDADTDADLDGGPGDADLDASDAGPGLGAPFPSLPADGQVLAPTRAYLSWQDGIIPSGESVASYESCYTTLGLTAIDDATECPIRSVDTNRFHVIDPLTPNTQYHWKVRSCRNVDGTDCSDYSAVRSLSTDDSLVGWWRMDTDAGNGDPIPDSSINGNNGTIVSDDIDNTIAGTGIIGQAFIGDGNNDHVVISPSASLDSINSTSFTIEVRAMANAVSGVQTLIGRGDGVLAQSNQYYRLALVDDVLTLEHKASGIDGDSRVISGTTPVVAGTWFHIASVRDIGNSLHIYRNGIEDAPTVADNVDSFDWTGFVRPLSLAALVNTTITDRLNGGLDEVAIFSGAKSAAVILNNYCAAEALAGADPLPIDCQP